MKVFKTSDLSGPIEWSGPTLTGIGEAAVKLRWVTTAFRWHRNDGPELFWVLDGFVKMHVRVGQGSDVEVVDLAPGEGIWIEDGEEHIAHPIGEARILVVEKSS